MSTLDDNTLNQLRDIFKSLPSPVKLVIEGDPNRVEFTEMVDFVTDFTSVSEMLSVKVEDNPTQFNAPVLSIWHAGYPSGVRFCGIPGGHEFSSLILAILNVCGIGKNMPDEATRQRIEAINGPIEIFTFVSLSCSICPDVVQALNIITLLNPAITNTVIDGGAAPDFIKTYNINGVPTVYANGELFSVGQASLGELIMKLEKRFGKAAPDKPTQNTPQGFDVIVAGGGPAGVAAAIYLARKAINVAVIAGRIGGQVKDTSDIENLISESLTTGAQLASDLRRNLDAYRIPIFDNRIIKNASLKGKIKRFTTDSGEIFEAPMAILATGATWKKLNIPGENEYIGKGVAFCTHCDGPFFAGKRVAVAGGGNSGVEAAIDLAAICSHVDIFEFLDSLKADEVLRNRLKELPNVSVHCSSAIEEVGGDGNHLTFINVKDRISGDVTKYEVSGLFIQIGLSPNSSIFATEININKREEIITDRSGRTDTAGIYAAGDVTDSPYKQIIIAMGSGATAALSAYNDMIRNV